MKYNKCFLCGKDVELNYYGKCFKDNKWENIEKDSECSTCYRGAYEKSCEDCGKAIITYCCFSSYNYNIYKEEINKNIKNYLKNNKNNGLCITNRNISQFINKNNLKTDIS